ncbi:doublecortin domain-containing protein 1 isoform X2 [Passer montanus]|uniref:doublecortin domain-containing protein 1 isoform X2 n=1 Tax=Passer montanus TaxID=9160 RepID=UPI0019619B09|nr:doublecortin domain-containing protein 1 isoform X2 [Passer montanus]
MNLALTQASLLDRRLQNVITPLCGPVWVFERGGFSPSGAEIYIRGVLLALHQRVKPAKCCKQPLEHLPEIVSGRKAQALPEELQSCAV